MNDAERYARRHPAEGWWWYPYEGFTIVAKREDGGLIWLVHDQDASIYWTELRWRGEYPSEESAKAAARRMNEDLAAWYARPSLFTRFVRAVVALRSKRALSNTPANSSSGPTDVRAPEKLSPAESNQRTNSGSQSPPPPASVEVHAWLEDTGPPKPSSDQRTNRQQRTRRREDIVPRHSELPEQW